MIVSENGLYPLNGHIFTAKMIIFQWNSNGVPTRAPYFQTSHLHLQLHGEAYSLVSPWKPWEDVAWSNFSDGKSPWNMELR